MNPGGIDHGLDPAVLDSATRELATAFMEGSRPLMARMANDPTISPPMVIASVVRAHLIGAASMVAASTPPVDSLLLVTWLIEALGEAMADVALAAEPTVGGVQ